MLNYCVKIAQSIWHMYIAQAHRHTPHVYMSRLLVYFSSGEIIDFNATGHFFFDLFSMKFSLSLLFWDICRIYQSITMMYYHFSHSNAQHSQYSNVLDHKLNLFFWISKNELGWGSSTLFATLFFVSLFFFSSRMNCLLCFNLLCFFFFRHIWMNFFLQKIYNIIQKKRKQNCW